VDVPKQTNGVDCGVMMCAGVEAYVTGRDFDCTREFAPQYRRFMASVLLRGCFPLVNA
jgi:Ulp1 family protease